MIQFEPLNGSFHQAVRTFILGSSKEIPYSGSACRIRKEIFLEMMLWWSTQHRPLARRKQGKADAGGRSHETAKNHAVGASLCGYQRRIRRQYDREQPEPQEDEKSSIHGIMRCCWQRGRCARLCAIAFVYRHGRNPYPLWGDRPYSGRDSRTA